MMMIRLGIVVINVRYSSHVSTLGIVVVTTNVSTLGIVVMSLAIKASKKSSTVLI